MGEKRKAVCRWGAVLLMSVCLLAVWGGVRLHGHTKGETRIYMMGNDISCGKKIRLKAGGLGGKKIVSCVWYVGDREVGRSGRLCSYTPKEKDLEQFIRAEVTLDDGTVFTDSRYLSVLPVLYLDSETDYKQVKKDENTEVQATLAGTGYGANELYQGAAAIHLRGNSTAGFPKRPFKLRLEKKASLLGMEESRHWVLLANAIDSTLLRNQLVNELAAELGAPCEIDSRQISLIYNGEYYGVYQLSEQVRVEEKRVSVYDWDKTASEAARKIAASLKSQGLIEKKEQTEVTALLEEELTENLEWLETGSFHSETLKDWGAAHNRTIPDTFSMEQYVDYEKLPTATGGVLLEMDDAETERSLTTAYHMPFYFVSPVAGETYPTLYQNIQSSLQAAEYALHSTDFLYHEDGSHYETKEEGTCNFEHAFAREQVVYEEREFSAAEYDGCHYTELLDENSLLVNFFVCELTMNWDSMKHSLFVYKDVDGKYMLSPAWDFDWAWGNSLNNVDTWIWDDWQTTNDYYTYETYYQSVQWNRYLIRDPYFLVLAWEKYREIREPVLEELIRDGGKIDQYAEFLRPAAKANDARWGGCMGTYQGQTFDEGLKQLKEFIRLRVGWLDEQFMAVESFQKSTGYSESSERVRISEMDLFSVRGNTVVTVETEAPECAGISLQVNGLWLYTQPLDSGKAVFEIPDSVLSEKGKYNCIQARLVGGDGAYLVNPEGTVEGDYTNAISNYAYFSR